MRRFIIISALAFCFMSSSAQKVLNVIGDSYVANHMRPKEEAWHCKLAK